MRIEQCTDDKLWTYIEVVLRNAGETINSGVVLLCVSHSLTYPADLQQGISEED